MVGAIILLATAIVLHGWLSFMRSWMWLDYYKNRDNEAPID